MNEEEQQEKHPDPELESNSRVDKAERRKDLRCSFCPPNRGENCKNYKKHGVKKKIKPRQ